MHVVAAVIRRGPEYLVGLRPLHKRHGGLWEFPGGKVETGESDLDATRRELEEELGVFVVSVGETLYAASDPGSSFLIRFIPTQVRGQARPAEHTSLRWATPLELQALPLAPSDARFVAEYLTVRA